MKKIISFVLAFVLTMASVTAIAGAEETAETINAGEAVETIFALDIMQKNNLGEMNLSENVTRAEFVMTLYRLLNYNSRNNDVFASTAYFNDVDIYHYAAGHVENMVIRGLIRGFDDGSFRPEDNITLEQVCSVLVEAAGYIDKDYMSVVYKTDMLKGVSLSTSDLVMREDLSKILYNLLYAEIMVKENDTYTVRGEFINEVLDIEYFDGVLDGVGGISLYNKDISEKLISVNKKEYAALFEANEEYLGYNVRCYLNKDKDALLIYPRRNEILTINSDEIYSYRERVYTYYDENGKKETAELKKDYDGILNGYYTDDVSAMLPDYGCVKLVDNNSDGDYDVAIVEAYESYVVGQVIDEEQFVLKNTKQDGSNTVFDLGDFAKYKIVNADETPASISSINENSVITVCRNSNKRIKIYTSKETVKGIPQGITSMDGVLNITIDDVVYKTVPDFYQGSWDGASIVNLILRMDINGRVAGTDLGTEADDENGWRFGYIRRVGQDFDTGEAVVRIKLLDQDGTTKNLEAAQRTTVDDQPIKDPKQLEDAIKAAYNNFEDTLPQGAMSDDTYKYAKENITTRLIRYRLNSDGKIARIDTPKRQSVYDSTETSTSAGDSFMMRCKGYMYYHNNQKQLKQVYASRLDLYGEVIVNSSTKVFVVPEESNTDPDEDDYFVTKFSSVGFKSAGQFVYAAGYNTDEHSLVCDAIVVRKNGGSGGQKIMVVDSVKKAVNEDDEVVDMAVGYVSKTHTELKIKDTKSNAVDPTSLATGDVILFTSINDEIIIDEVIYNSAGTGVINNTHVYSPEGTTHFNADYRVLKGKAARMSDGYFLIDVGTTAQLGEIVTASSMVIVDLEEEREPIKTGNISELRTAEYFANDADTVLLSTDNGKIVDVIVIR